MYTCDKEFWGKFVKRMAKLGIEPTDPKRASKQGNANKYLAVEGSYDQCFEWQSIVDGFMFQIEKLLKQTKEQQETIKTQQETIEKLLEMRGFLASKELQQSMLARIDFLEKNMEKKTRK